MLLLNFIFDPSAGAQGVTMSVFPVKQALRNSCELLRQRKELHASSWTFMQAHVSKIM